MKFSPNVGFDVWSWNKAEGSFKRAEGQQNWARGAAHPFSIGLAGALLHSTVSIESVSWQWRPWSICMDTRYTGWSGDLLSLLGICCLYISQFHVPHGAAHRINLVLCKNLRFFFYSFYFFIRHLQRLWNVNFTISHSPAISHSTKLHLSSSKFKI